MLSGASDFLRLLRLTDVSDIFLHYVKLVALIGVSTISLSSRGIDFKIVILASFAISVEIFAFVINDISDADLDKLDPRTRNPLARGGVSERGAVFVALLFLTISVFLLLLLPLGTIALGVSGLILSFTYSYGVRAKLKPFLDVVYHGALNAFPFAMGYTLYNSFDETCLLVSVTIFLLGMVPELMQEIRDHHVDRAFGKTTVVALGIKRSLTLCLGLMIALFFVVAAVLDRVLFFPIILGELRIPIHFVTLPPLSLFVLTPLFRGIRSEAHQTALYERLGKRWLVVFIILASSSSTIAAYSSVVYTYGDAEWGDYVVRLDVRTVIAGPERWSVAFIGFRYSDDSNHYHLLLYQDGVLELAKTVGSKKTYLNFVRTDLSPFDWHRFEIALKGPSIKVWVDGAQFVDVVDDSLSNGVIRLSGFYSARLAFFKNVEVDYH